MTERAIACFVASTGEAFPSRRYEADEGFISSFAELESMTVGTFTILRFRVVIKHVQRWLLAEVYEDETLIAVVAAARTFLAGRKAWKAMLATGSSLAQPPITEAPGIRPFFATIRREGEPPEELVELERCLAWAWLESEAALE